MTEKGGWERKPRNLSSHEAGLRTSEESSIRPIRSWEKLAKKTAGYFNKNRITRRRP